jgi:hypothetical protein
VTTHHLKTWPRFFEAVVSGAKPFELRRLDRPYATGDRLVLEEWDPATEKYTGRHASRDVMYMVAGPCFGLPEGHCILGLSRSDADLARAEAKGWADALSAAIDEIARTEAEGGVGSVTALRVIGNLRSLSPAKAETPAAPVEASEATCNCTAAFTRDVGRHHFDCPMWKCPECGHRNSAHLDRGCGLCSCPGMAVPVATPSPATTQAAVCARCGGSRYATDHDSGGRHVGWSVCPDCSGRDGER